MKLTGHKTEAVYRRYAIVSEADLAAGVTRLAVLHESLTKATRTVVPMRPVRSGGDHSERGGCGPPPVAAPRSGPQATRAPPQHLRAGVPRSRPRGRATCSRWRRGRPPASCESPPGCWSRAFLQWRSVDDALRPQIGGVRAGRRPEEMLPAALHPAVEGTPVCEVEVCQPRLPVGAEEGGGDRVGFAIVLGHAHPAT